MPLRRNGMAERTFASRSPRDFCVWMVKKLTNGSLGLVVQSPEWLIRPQIHRSRQRSVKAIRRGTITRLPPRDWGPRLVAPPLGHSDFCTIFKSINIQSESSSGTIPGNGRFAPFLSSPLAVKEGRQQGFCGRRRLKLVSSPPEMPRVRSSPKSRARICRRVHEALFKARDRAD